MAGSPQSIWRNYQENITAYELEHRKQLEIETMKRERKSIKLSKKWGKPLIRKLTKEEMESNAKIRGQLAHRNYRVCLSCAGIPTHIVSYDLKGAAKIERYCDSCISKITT